MNKIEQTIFPNLTFGEETYIETIEGPSHTCFSIKQCETREGGDIHPTRIEYDNIPKVIDILQKVYIHKQIMPKEKLDSSANFVQLVQTQLEKIIAIIHQDFIGSGEFTDKIVFENGTLYFYGKNEYQAKTNKELFITTCLLYNIQIIGADENKKGITNIFQHQYSILIDSYKDKVYR